MTTGKKRRNKSVQSKMGSFVLDAAGAACMIGAFGKDFHAKFGFQEADEFSSFTPTELQFLHRYRLAQVLGTRGRQYVQYDVPKLYEYARAARLPVNRIVIKVANLIPGYDFSHFPHWYNNPATGKELAPLTQFPYIYSPPGRAFEEVVLDANLKGSALTVYDVLMAMRAVNTDPWRMVLRDEHQPGVQIFPMGDTWELVIKVDPDN